ncbi:hypothetical protein PTKIN_Ptkin02bG0090900 [Pterospermum kingtungense]
MMMGEKARKASKKIVKKAYFQFPHSDSKIATADFLPLEGDLSRELSETKPQQNNATVLYIGRIPHGFYEKEMEGKSILQENQSTLVSLNLRILRLKL